MVLVMLAEGFEEIEALTPVDIMRRCGIDVMTVGISGKTVTGSHSIPVVADILPEEIPTEGIEMVVFPGGMPGSINLDASPLTDKVLELAKSCCAHIAAICAAPLILGRRGLLSGKHATCFPGFEDELRGAIYVKTNVVTDGNITTASGMTVALDFANELTRVLQEKDERVLDHSTSSSKD